MPTPRLSSDCAMKFGRDGRSEIAERIRDTAEDLMELVSAQVKLRGLDLLGDAGFLGARLVRVAISLPLAVLGWGFLASAGAGRWVHASAWAGRSRCSGSRT